MSIHTPYNTGVYHHSDEQVQCQSCFTFETTKIGDVKDKDGDVGGVYRCNSCSTLTIDDPASVKALKESIENYNGTDKVTFTNHTIASDCTVTNTVPNITGPIDTELTYNSQEVIRDITRSVQTLDSNLGSKLDNLLWEIQRVIEENQKLQEKLTNDPLRHLKGMINEFNLK